MIRKTRKQFPGIPGEAAVPCLTSTPGLRPSGGLAAALLTLTLLPGKAADAPAATIRPAQATRVRALRLAGGPIIRQDMPNVKGRNTNGPSLIRAPDFIAHPLGKYYLYFADHHGQRVSLAYADAPTGPWTAVKGGVLSLDQTACKKHIASPDVHVDPVKKELLMYFHGPARDGGKQLTYLARSTDGLHFTAGRQALGPSYFCVFQHDGWFYTITKREGTGNIYRSRDGITPFEAGPALIPNLRHSGVLADGDVLWLFYTKIGDAPERIFATRINLAQDWAQWKISMSEPQLVLKPEEVWEGAQAPLVPSVSGGAKGGRVNQLRDPAIFREGDRTYMTYACAGETGLAIAELVFEK